ncbi:MAG: hypothetical protein D6760_07075 [Deltaproteobacteria bacterium]|nr:MAG: hypothetical protein D6760_07075 [Deltaproteobacteria bacterium]
MFLATVSLACGSASSGGGITGSGLVVGPIAGFGSAPGTIIVNAIEIDTSQAQVRIDGVDADPSSLRLGMVVRVRGSIDPSGASGVASLVEFNDELEGPVDSVDAAGGRFTVLGHIVMVDASTVFENTSLATLAPGDVVEVSGLRNAAGDIAATRVERKTGVGEFEVKGTVFFHDPVAKTFTLGSLTVDYSSARVEGAPSGGLRDGLFVEVKTKSAPSGGVLLADKIEVKSEGLGGREGEEAEIEGLITDIVSPSEIVVGGTQTVLITDQTKFEGGTASDLALDVKIEAKGTFNAAGAVVAKKIEFDD